VILQMTDSYVEWQTALNSDMRNANGFLHILGDLTCTFCRFKITPEKDALSK
jgi:hypothetical protein